MAKWELLDKDWEPVHVVILPEDDMPTLVIYDGRYFVFDDPENVFLEATPFMAPKLEVVK